MRAPAGHNLAAWLRLRAEESPDRPALRFITGRGPQRAPTDNRGAAAALATYAHRTFRQLDCESDVVARGLQRSGVARGALTILLVRPSRELFVVLFALFKLGAVPVVVDPGMGLDRMLHCYRSVAAQAFIGIPAAHAVRALRSDSFPALKTLVTVGERAGWGGVTLAELEQPGEDLSPFPLAEVSADDPLIINFTTGSTGPAKGVEYTHATGQAMLRTIAAHFQQDQSDTSLVTLTLLGAFDVMLGTTAVLAPMNPARPAHADPALMIDVIQQHQITQMFASPALLHRLAQHAQPREIKLPSLRRIIAGGAPVSPTLVAQLRGLLPEAGRVHVTYGATEALPIASLEAEAILGETAALTRAGRGTCVGRPLGQTEARIIKIDDGALPAWSEDLVLPPGAVGEVGEVGEICVRGPIVSPRYHQSPQADALHKIPAPGGAWHRTGDLGWLDQAGRLWFCGRKSQRVLTAEGPRFTVQWEGVFNAHPDVYRSALVGVGPAGAPKEPVVCIEARAGLDAAARRALPQALAALASEHHLTPPPRAFLLHRGFPVDVRHNAKIHREELAAFAESRLGIAGEATAPERRARPLYVVPLFGWLLIAYGLLWPFSHPVLRGIWYIDLFLSIVVHGAQLWVALPAGRRAGLHPAYTTFMTFLLGATWWRPLRARGSLR